MLRTCPTCGESAEVDPTSKWRPFCSRRCKLVDLGNWMDGAYRISRPLGAEDFEGNEALLSQMMADAAAKADED